MRKFPEDKDKRITSSNWIQYPHNVYGFAHPTEFTKVRIQKNKVATPSKIEYNIQKDLLDVVVNNEKGEEMKFGDWLTDSKTNGFLIAKDGKIVLEEYFNELEETSQAVHLSCTKSYTGVIAAQLIAEGLLDPEKLVKDYLPELENSDMGKYKVRRLLDMQTPMKFSEDYTDPNAEIWAYGVVMGGTEKPAGYDGPETLYDFIAQLKDLEDDKGRPDMFRYITPNIDTIAWICKRIKGKHLTELVEEYALHPIDHEHDLMWMIDGSGAETAGTGLLVTMRDAYRFGQLMANEGKYNGKQVLDKNFFDIMHEEAAKTRPNFEGSGADKFDRETYSYWNQIWFSNWENKSYSFFGYAGQVYYIDPVNNVVAIKFTAIESPGQEKVRYQTHMFEQLSKHIK